MIRNWFNHDPLEKGTEKPFGASLTVPDQALPLKTLLERYVRGQEVHQFEPVYLGEDEEFVGVENMTFDERHEYLLQVNASIADARRRLAASRPSHVEDAIVEEQIMSAGGKEETSTNKKTKKDTND